MTPRLLCHPGTEALPQDLPERVRACLDALGLLGPAFQVDEETRYHAGPALLEQITFLGCAPDIELEPPAAQTLAEAARAGRFCHWRLTPLYPRPRLRRDPLAAPRCPACRQALASLTAAGEAATLRCPACGAEAPPGAWRWKQYGAHARFFLELVGVHAGEAVPGETLLGALEEITGGRWGFAYVRD